MLNLRYDPRVSPMHAIPVDTRLPLLQIFLNYAVETPNDVHADEIETNTSLAVRPYVVKIDQARREVPEFSSRYLDFTSKRGVSWYAHTRKISQSGVMGDPTKASADKGKKIREIMITYLVALVEDLKSMTLEEIFQQ